MDLVAHMEHLQTALKEFNSIAALNEETLIPYFRDGLHPFIQAQVNNQRRDLDAWEEVVEKAVEVKTKADFQTYSMIREINFECPKEHWPLIKKDKNDAYREHRNETSNKNKKRLSPIRRLPLISLRPRTSKKINVMEVGEVIQLLGSMPLR